MARYHAGFATVAAATNAACFDIRTGSGDRVRVLEIGVFNVAATAALITLERQTTLGTTSATTTPQAGEPGDAAATAVVGTAWSVAPAGSTTAQLRRINLPANIGAGIVWTFGYSEMVIPVSSSLICMNRGAASTGILACYVVLDE